MLNYFDNFKNKGIIKIKNFLTSGEVEIVDNILRNFVKEKGHKNNLFSVNFLQQLYKVLKLDFNKLFSSQKLINLSKNKNLQKISDSYFGSPSKLKMIDGYLSPISNKEVLPWHVDCAYSGASNVKSFIHPDNFSIKCIIYLTNVSSDNGCTSYVEKSNLIAYFLRKAIYDKKINYEPYWSLKDFRKIIKKNLNFFNNNFPNFNIVNEFLDITKFIELDQDCTDFDFAMSPGDAIIFDEGGVHKGSKLLKNERLVLRYHFSRVN